MDGGLVFISKITKLQVIEMRFDTTRNTHTEKSSMKHEKKALIRGTSAKCIRHDARCRLLESLV